MSSRALRTVGTAFVERVTGEGPSRTRAIAAAVVTGVVTGAATYRLLRGGGDDGDDD
jgi:hypothetical protein